MTNKRIKHCIVFIIIFLSFVHLAYAGLEITEIMYAPEAGAGYDWVEIYNNGPNLDITGYRFFRGSDNENSTSGPITNRVGSSILKTNEYAILTSNMSDYSWLDFSGSIFSISSSIISLPSSGDNTYIAISDPAKKVIDDVTYDVSKGGSKTSKTSLSKINGEWTSATPTSGAANSSSNNSFDNSSEDNITDETIDPVPLVKDNPAILKITTKIVAPKIVTAGVPFSIDHATTGINKEKIILGKFIWNFGDGMSKIGTTSDAFNYVYDYPGDYVITLSYSDSTFDTKPDATDRLTVKVIPSGINISSVGTYTDPFVELENKSSYEMSISGWILRGNVHSFMIPEGTVILSNKKLKLSPRITGFDFNDLSSISIIDTSGQVFATYPNIIKPVVKYSTNKNEVKNIVKSDIVESNQIDSLANSPDVINLNDLGASAGGVENGLNNKTLIYLGLAGIIIIGIISIILIKRKNEIPDYVEGGISAKDMTIME